ncbi:MAG: hypothetical protein ACLSVD_11750 [Eggerthellaceae bacterium]
MLACTAHESAFHPCLVSACSRRWWWLFRSSSPPISCTDRPARRAVAPRPRGSAGGRGLVRHAAVAIGLLVRVSTRAAQAPRCPRETGKKSVPYRTGQPGSLAARVRCRRAGVSRLFGKKIASTLYLGVHRETHTSHVYRKVGIHSKQELIAFIDAFRTEG